MGSIQGESPAVRWAETVAGLSVAGAVVRITTAWCRAKGRGQVAHHSALGDMMTGCVEADAAWRFEGVEQAVNIEETCQQAVETQPLGC